MALTHQNLLSGAGLQAGSPHGVLCMQESSNLPLWRRAQSADGPALKEGHLFEVLHLAFWVILKEFACQIQYETFLIYS